MINAVVSDDSTGLEDFFEDFCSSDSEPIHLHVEDDNSSVSSEPNDYVIETNYIRKKRKYVLKNPRPVRIPRVMLFDIRKCYAKMIVNVMNSGDFPLLYGFMDTYFAPNAHHTSTKVVKCGDSRNVFSMNVYGCEELAKYWYSFMTITPDGISTICDATIQNTTGKIVSSISKQATQIYELRDSSISNDYLEYILVEQSNPNKVDFSSNNTATTSNNNNNNSSDNNKRKVDQLHEMEDKKTVMRSIMKSVECAVSGLRLRSHPLHLNINGTFAICTDENKRITRLEACVEY